MIVNSLFPKVRQRVLTLLFTQPENNFYTNEIIRATKMGHGVVQRELEKLSAMGLLTVTLIGNQKHYQADQQTPLYNEIRNIVLKTFGLTEELKNRLQPISQKIKIAFVYGSIAKQTDTLMSDIDVLLIGNDLTYMDIFTIMSEAEHIVQRKINPTIYSVDEWQKKYQINHHFIKKIIEQPKIFLIGAESDLQQLQQLS